MTELFKNIYNKTFFDSFNIALTNNIPNFDKDKFNSDIFSNDWEQKELKQRMRHISTVLKDHLSSNYRENIFYITKIIEYIKQSNFKESSLEYMFFADFVEQYGLNHLDVSLNAIEFITQFISCEFAIRPFIQKHPNKTLEKMKEWSLHENHHVRRLASEGCRPRLPWASALPDLKKDPSSILPILENLKTDESEYVRRSVANNLNDISKDNPDIVLNLLQKWKGISKETDWVIKHGSRTLLRKADPQVLSIFGMSNKINCKVSDLNIKNEIISIGDHLEFSFNLSNLAKEDLRARVEYAIYYVKANGKQSKKLFKITENVYKHKEVYKFNRKQSFRDMTTRKHYIGTHKLSIVINGNELIEKEFI
ncbi:MAG: DNA alkylation repair protein, partial [Candidatus Sericytochromatia bacterium]